MREHDEVSSNNRRPFGSIVGVAAALSLQAGCGLELSFDDCTQNAHCAPGAMCVDGQCEAPDPTTEGEPTVGDQPGPECEAGDAEVCTCLDGTASDRTCTADGEFGECDCPFDVSCREIIQASTDFTVLDDGFPYDEDTRFYVNVGEDLGVGDETPDEMRFEFWDGAPPAAMANLGSETNRTYRGCIWCLRLYQDTGSQSVGWDYYEGTQYMQIEGTLTMEDSAINGIALFRLDDVTLVESFYTLDDAGDEYDNTPVENGACVIIPDGVYATPLIPTGWTCEDSAYTDVICDCGCGVIDQACEEDTSNEVCARCDAEGSCSSDALCPGTIDPDDNSTCVDSGGSTPEDPAAAVVGANSVLDDLSG